MKTRRSKTEAKPITITAERLSDKSRITFTISSDKTIEQLRALLNHHLPPLHAGKFDLYSYQRGALIHFHPSSFKLDYFPVIFDQSVLLLKMDDRVDIDSSTEKSDKLRKDSRKESCLLWNDFVSAKSSPTRTSSTEQPPRSTTVTCLSILKQIFRQSSSQHVNKHSEGDVLS